MKFTADTVRKLELALQRSAAANGGTPNLTESSRKLQIDRRTLRARWQRMVAEGRTQPEVDARGDFVRPAKPSRPTSSPTAARAEVAALLGRPEDDPLVTIGTDLREQRDATETETAKAQLTKELSRFLVLHRSTSGRQGPMTPDEHIARCREWVEYTIEALLAMPEALTDDRVIAAVDAAREPA